MNPQPEQEQPKGLIDEIDLKDYLRKLNQEDIFYVKLLEQLDPRGKAAQLLRQEIAQTANSFFQAMVSGNSSTAMGMLTYLVELGFQIGTHHVDRDTLEKMEIEIRQQRLEDLQ